MVIDTGPFYFKAEEDNVTIKLTGNVYSILEYSYDGVNFTSLPVKGSVTLAHVGDRVYFRRSTDDTMNRHVVQATFELSKKAGAYGSVTWLIYSDGQIPSSTALQTSAFSNLFKDCANLTHAPSLPATNLGQLCYYNMFHGCTGLTEAPDLPAETLAEGCYKSMFSGCTGIDSAVLRATTLANQSCESMFEGCSNLQRLSLKYDGEFNDGNAQDFLKDTAVNERGVFYAPDSTTFSSGVLPDNWQSYKEVLNMAAHLKLHDIMSAADHAVGSAGTSILTTGQKGAVVYNEAGAFSGMQIETTGSMIVTRDDNGRLFMSAAPTANDHVANKKYVDDQISGGKKHEIFDATAHEVGTAATTAISGNQLGFEVFNTSGTFSVGKIDAAATANTIPVRDANGDITLNGSQAMTSGSVAATIDNVIRLAQAEIAATKFHEINNASYHNAAALGAQLTDTAGTGVVTYNASGVIGGQKLVSTATADAIVKRDANGQIFVPTTPISDGQAASKGYVDKTVAESIAAGIWKSNTTAVIADASGTVTVSDVLPTGGDANKLVGKKVVSLADKKVYTIASVAGTQGTDTVSFYAVGTDDEPYVPNTSERRHDDKQDKDWAFDVEGNAWLDLGSTAHSQLHDMDSAADHNYTANTLYYGSATTGATAASLTFTNDDAGKAVKVNSAGTALEFGPLSLAALANTVTNLPTGQAEPLAADVSAWSDYQMGLMIGDNGNGSLFLAIRVNSSTVKSVELA